MNELIEMSVTYKGYHLLEYLKENYFGDVVGADLQKARPLIFRESRDVKQAFDELVAADLIHGDYDKGNISNPLPNVEKLKSLTDISGGITVVKKATTRKKKTSELPDEITDIIKHYSSYASLPRPSTATPLAIQRIESQLKLFSPEQVKEALTFASEQSWLINKGSENWCNLSWVMNVVHEFAPGGKYRTGASTGVVENKYASIEDNNTEVIW